MTTRVFAPAKVNLALHVTGQRSDGYHMLDSLVAFADVGDVVTLAPAQVSSLNVTGPEAGAVPPGEDNVVARVLRTFGGSSLAVGLHKVLPVASGIGGGSADAAACYRGLRLMAGKSGLVPDTDARLLLEIGADVPMCVANLAARVRGIGEEIRPIAGFPLLHALLVNPRVPVATPAVFRALANRSNPPMDALPEGLTAADWTAWLGLQRNDLQAAATGLCPQIGEVIAALDDAGSALSRMSGSGATCFALFADAEGQAAATVRLRRDHPDWWIAPTRLGHQPDTDQVSRATT